MAGVALTAACARQGAPPGGPEDRRPPVVVATRPDTYAVVEDFRGPVRFIFDERVSERVTGGALNSAVLVSPRTGEVEVDHNRGGIEVSLVGGFEEGRVYRVTLLPVVSDLFGNQMRDAFELVFSTGAELVPSAVAGLAWDRVTGRGVDGLRVIAMDTRDSTVYMARTDTGGIYAFRYLPPGPYRVTAFEDRNADDEVGEMEPQGRRVLQLTGPDTVVVEIGVLQPDTTPAVLTAAEVLDSVTVTLSFDEPLDPTSRLNPGNVSVTPIARGDSAGLVRDEDGDFVLDREAPAPQTERLFHEHEYASWAAAVRDSLTRLDSLDRARAAEASEEGDTALAASLREGVPRPLPTSLSPGGQRARRPAGGARQGSAGESEGPAVGPDGRPLPSQRLVVRLGRALVPNRAYQVVATGVTNMNGLPLGGGTAVVVRQPPDTSAADSAGVAADSLGTGADSVGVVPDTTGPVPDTLSTVPDTTGAVPDTASVEPPDTAPSLPDTLGVASRPVPIPRGDPRSSPRPPIR